jgi:hypothetical protein
MLESDDGAIVSATRQKSGRFVIGPPVGGWNDPAGIDCAAVIVAYGISSEMRLSQVAPIAGDACESASATAAERVFQQLLLDMTTPPS